MQALKPIFGVIRAVVPVVYCGWLIHYFLTVCGSVEQAKMEGLGPTLLGLAVVGLLFSIPLIVKIVAVVVALRSARRPDNPSTDDDGFDADAAIARYKAQRSAESVPHAPPAGGGAAPARPSFGRKIK